LLHNDSFANNSLTLTKADACSFIFHGFIFMAYNIKEEKIVL